MQYQIECRKDPYSLEVCKNLKKILKEEVSLKPHVVFTVGGDGTFLDAVRKYKDDLDHIMFVAIHTGNLGFYTEFLPHEIEEMVKNIKTLPQDTYTLLDVFVDEEEDIALNEVTISAHHQLLEGSVLINQEPLMDIRANGLCIATPSGSTAYNKSLKGAIMDSKVASLQLTLIAPFETVESRTISPLVLSDSYKITFKPKNSYIDITMDRLFISKEAVRSIVVKRSLKQVKYLKNPKNSFIRRIKEKFIGN